MCRRLVDYGRASEWTDAARQWCDREGILRFPGVCRVYRAGILRLRGALADAAREATSACEELRPYAVGPTGEAFYELGEVRLSLGDLTAAEEAFMPAHAAEPSPARAETRTFMFTDIVRSTQLIEAIGDEAWEDLVRWHNQTLRALFTTHGGEEVDHAGDGFFVAFAASRPAIECGVAIQRTLLDHRRTQGLAPQVRIGLHTAPAPTSTPGPVAPSARVWLSAPCSSWRPYPAAPCGSPSASPPSDF